MGDSCFTIGLNFGTNATMLETWNINTFHWKGCSQLDVGLNMCVSSGSPPPVPVNPNVECGPETAGNVTCPLNACCSAFGFCGTTVDFCTAAPNGDPCNSNCFIPTMPSCPNGTLKRKVGYFAGWAAQRPCEAVTTQQVSLDGLTHVLYAFATISDDMQIVLDDDDVQPLQDLVARKGSTKVMIALGGWTFSEADPTKPLFSTMIGTSGNRATFIASTEAFLNQYGLDGIDVDMEYPGAVERGGPPSDTPNLTLFFTELRAALPSTTISLASPAGYWFMRGYQLDQIAPSVSFINLMAYGYHGPWDLTVHGETPTANPHTSIEDIKDSVLLYQRIGIDMSLVNLGTAYYGRTFRLADPSCGMYGCNFTSGGANGTCTGASGILSYSEITRLDNFTNEQFDSTSITKFFMQGSDLVTFDDKDTWDAKTQFAAQTCFGGTMIWSIDQVDPPAPTTTSSSSPPASTGTPCTDAQNWAQTRIQTLWDTYIPYIPDPDVVFSGGWEDSSDVWHDVVNMEAAANYMIQTGTTTYNSDLLTSHVSFDGFLFSPVSFQNGQDDALWAVLLYMIIGDFQAMIGSPNEDYWTAALENLDWVGQDTGHFLPFTGPACDGGVWWKHNNNDQVGGWKNTITNALFIQASARAFMKGAGSQYLDQAIAAWEYVSRMRDPADGLYNDGPVHNSTDCPRDGGSTKWTYNQGTMVGALGSLYKATGNKTYIDEALITIDGIVAHMSQDGILFEGCDVTTGDVCNHDQVNFKGLCLRHISYFLDFVDDPTIVARYSDWFGQQAKGINANAQDGNGLVTSVWCVKDSSLSQADGRSDVQRSVLDAMLVAMKYGTC